jgi:hypothetical protein
MLFPWLFFRNSIEFLGLCCVLLQFGASEPDQEYCREVTTRNCVSENCTLVISFSDPNWMCQMNASSCNLFECCLWVVSLHSGCVDDTFPPSSGMAPKCSNCVLGAIGSQLTCNVSGALKNVQQENRAHTFEHSMWYWYNTQAAEVRFLLKLWINVTSGAGSLIVKPSKWRSDVKGGFPGKNRVFFYDYYKSCDQVSVGLRGS